MKKVLVYSKYNCPYCVRAKELLKEKKVGFQEINVEDFPKEKEIMIERTNGKRTLPQIFIDGISIGGCDELYELENKKELDSLLDIEKNTLKGSQHHKVAIIGSGPAGYTAAIYAARANLNPVIFAGIEKGGQLTSTTDVENFPGFRNGIDGNALMTEMEEQSKRFGTEIISREVDKVELDKRPFKIYKGDEIHTAESIIIATGAKAKYLGLPSEKKYLGRGVSGCATCDGYFFKGEEVAIVGGGDTAMEEAIYLSNLCKKVYLIHRRDEFRASKTMQDRVKGNDKIEILHSNVIEEIIGDEEKVTSLKIRDIKSNEVKHLEVGGVFIAIGHSPSTNFLNGQLPIDENGFLLKNNGTETIIPGVFVSGDVADPHYRQAITAAGSGAMAALDSEKWLELMKTR